MDTYVQQVIKRFVVTEEKDYLWEIEANEEKLVALRERLNGMTKLESKTSRMFIVDEIAELEEKIARLYMAKKGYPVVFDIEALRLRYREGSEKGLPVFAVFDFDSEEDFSIRPKGFKRLDEVVFTPGNLTSDIKKCYSDLFPMLNGEEHGRKVIMRLAASWEGMFPEEVTGFALTQAKKSKLFERIFFVPQIDDWTVTGRIEPIPLPPPRPVRSDPFVIGLREKTWYLIAHFDPSDLEKLVHNQFTNES